MGFEVKTPPTAASQPTAETLLKAPTIGRIVHVWTRTGGPHAAIVTAVDPDTDTISVFVFPPDAAPYVSSKVASKLNGLPIDVCWEWPPLRLP